MQKRVAGQAVGLRIAGCVECLNPVATDGVIGAVSEVRAGVVNPELRVVENVEDLRAELQPGAFLYLERLHQAGETRLRCLAGTVANRALKLGSQSRCLCMGKVHPKYRTPHAWRRIFS